jgi:hypothetical protein
MLPEILRRFARVPFEIHGVISSRCFRFSIERVRYSSRVKTFIATLLTTHSLSASVDDFVAAKAPNFNKIRQSSTSRQQTIQKESLRNDEIQQVSITFAPGSGSGGRWFKSNPPDHMFSTT